MTTPTPVPPALSAERLTRMIQFYVDDNEPDTVRALRELQSLRERVEAFASRTDDISGNSYLNWRLQLGELAKDMRAAIANGAKDRDPVTAYYEDRAASGNSPLEARKP
jgi:hypothetical protein